MSHSQMPNVVVERYENPIAMGGWLGCVAPKERDWILFVPVDGLPVLFARTQVSTGDGVTHESYARASTVEKPRLPATLDFVVRPYEVHTGGPNGETALGFTAELLGGPPIAGDGLTEHEAIRRLLNYVAEVSSRAG